MKRSERKSGLELLRILAIMGVILLHYNDGRAFTYVQGGANLYVLYFLESLCICAVNVFILISGYFLSGSQRRSYIKPLELIVQLVLFKMLFYFVKVVLGRVTFSFTGVLGSVLPNNYFVMLYCALYCISPYLNRIFTGFTHKQWNRFLLVLFVLFSIWPTVTDLMEEIRGVEWIGISTITLTGAHQGFSIVNFSLIYFVGAYLRFNDPKVFKTKTSQLIGIVVTTVVIFVWALCLRGAKMYELRSAWVYHNPLVILLAALLFMLFRSLPIKSKMINEFAGASFTCFLLHSYLMPYMAIEKYAVGNTFGMLLHILVVQIICYIISYIAYKCYGFVTGWFFKALQKNVRFLQNYDDV